jgi:hypothetical protein
MAKYKLANGWTVARYRELLELRALLYEVAGIGNAAPFLRRMEACIKAANKLTRTRRTKRFRQDFMGWLQDTALIKVPDDEK